MNIISKYLCKEFLIHFFMVLAFITIVIFIFDFIELSRIASKKNIEFSNVLILSTLKAPIHVQKIIVFALFFASLITFNKLSKSSEITIIKASGLSAYQYIIPTYYSINHHSRSYICYNPKPRGILLRI